MNTHRDAFHNSQRRYPLIHKNLRNVYKNQHIWLFGNNIGLESAVLFPPKETFTAATLGFYVVGDSSRHPATDFGFGVRLTRAASGPSALKAPQSPIRNPGAVFSAKYMSPQVR